MPAPESPFVTLLVLSALSASSVSEQLHPLHMVLEAPDYGFIGLKLKGLIFQESGNTGARCTEYAYWGRKMAKENGVWRLVSQV